MRYKCIHIQYSIFIYNNNINSSSFNLYFLIKAKQNKTEEKNHNNIQLKTQRNKRINKLTKTYNQSKL